MASPSVILKAWKEVLKGRTSEEHKRRATICMNCPAAQHSTLLELVKDELKEIQGLKCLDCGCPLSPKIRSTDICYKWEQDFN